MATMKDILSQVMAKAKNDIAARKITNPKVIAEYKAGITNVSNEADIPVASIAQYSNTLEDTINSLISSIEFSLESTGIYFTEAQRQAARAIAPYALAPSVYIDQMDKMKRSSAAGEYFANESAGVDAMVGTELAKSTLEQYTALSTEAYDGQSLKNSIFFTIAYNLGAAKQDEFGEAFFPTITIDPLQFDVNISIEYTSIIEEFLRSTSGKAQEWKRTPVIKAIYDNKIFTADKNRVVPVYREDSNKELFLHEQKYVTEVSGESLLTAPLLFDKKLDILGISQTDSQLAKGTMDNTDALDGAVRLDKLYFSIKQGENTDVFLMDPSIYTTTTDNFTAAPQDHHKSMLLNYKARNFVVNISTLKTWNGGDSVVLQKAAESNRDNYKLVFDIDVHGELNVMQGDVRVNKPIATLVEIRDASNRVLATTDAAYTALKAFADSFEIVGYELEAYRTNSNLRTRGMLVSNDAYNHIYAVPFHAGVTALFPVSNQRGTDNDAGTLTSQVMMAGIYTSAYAVKKLTELANSLATHAEHGLLNGVKIGVGSYLVDPWFNTESFDLSSIVDSTQSADRDEDIRQALRLKIRSEVMNMYTRSNYGAAFEVLRGNLGGKIGVIIGTDPVLMSLLVKDDNTFLLGENFEARVVSTLNPLVAGKIFITFGVFDDTRNTTPNPLNFGNCLWSPTLTFDVPKTTNGALSRELHNMPRFRHVVHLPILSVYNVNDVNKVFGKIPVNINKLNG